MVETIKLEKAIRDYGATPNLEILYAMGIELVDVGEEIRALDRHTDGEIERRQIAKAEEREVNRPGR